jgi:hypothetical protein
MSNRNARVRPTAHESFASFEATYPRYEFSELVRLGLALAGGAARPACVSGAREGVGLESAS